MPISRRAAYTAGGVIAALVIIIIIAISVGHKSSPTPDTNTTTPIPPSTTTSAPTSTSTSTPTSTSTSTPTPTSTSTPAPTTTPRTVYKPTSENLTANRDHGPFDLPKAPHWDNQTQSLFFVDVYEELIHKYTPSENKLVTAKVGKGPMAFIIPITGTSDQFIVSAGPNLGIVTWDGMSSNITSYTEWTSMGDDVYRANEGKVAPSGSLFVGGHSPFKPDNQTEVEPNKANLYVFKKDKTPSIVIPNVTVANGMAWNKDETVFYFIDSLAYTVSSFTYDKRSDSLTNAQVLLSFKEKAIAGCPDGMTIDSEDKLWITSFKGALVLRFDPNTKEILETIELNASEVTSVLFGGSNLDHMFVTTGSYNMNETEKQSYNNSGYLFEQLKKPGFGRPSTTFGIKV